MSASQKTKHAEELLRRFAAALRAVQLYAPTHPLVSRGIAALAEALALVHASSAAIAIGVVGEELVVGDVPIPRAAETMAKLLRQLHDAGVERIVIDKGVQPSELSQLVQALGGTNALEATKALGPLPHIRVGRLQVEESTDASASDIATCRQLYQEAVTAAQVVWDSARTEGQPDADAGRRIVDALAQEVSQNRGAMLALTALKEYDSYTFTHMVNVSILTMAQARALGIDGALLREFGQAALMHDVGKVRVPPEILNKVEKLTDDEFDILRRHTVDGAEILRLTPEIPALAPVVAFEHHLRLDGSGYPAGVSRSSLNLGTMLCGIADVYDAMRSQRVYQGSFPTDRILAVLQRNDGTQFDQHLVRRFAQLVGIYPVGNLVRLNTGEVAVVLRIHAPDPYRPRVRVLFDNSGRKMDSPMELNLWETQEPEGRVIQAPVDPAAYDVDALTYI